MAFPEPVSVPPVKQGAAGRAWSIDAAAAREALGKDPAASALVASWIVEAPYAHPLWHSYSLTLVHLRPVFALPEPIRYRDDATHELPLVALDPNFPRDPMLRGGPLRVLRPANFAAQLAEPTDAAAIARIDGTVDLVVAGSLNPDTDFRQQWVALFGDAMVKPVGRQVQG